MSEFNKPNSETEFEANFEQIKPLMTATLAHNESSRCLFCYDAPCITACPTGIDVPLFIRQIYNGNTKGAAKTIYDANYFGNACGKVCPTEVLCEGSCVYNHEDAKPIEIGRLQNFATNLVIENNTKLYEIPKPNGKKIGIIGAGPAGISCACELRLEGYEVDIFEAKEKPSGLTVYGVAPYKITNEEALAEMVYLEKQFGFNVHYKSPINDAADLKKLEANYDAIFIGIGLGDTNILSIKGNDLENCEGATEFIERLRMDHTGTSVGKSVVVIGGGNTAMDAASESARLGAESVVLAYRRPKGQMGAYEFEYDLAKAVGVQGVFGVSPKEIIGEQKVEGITFIRNEVKDGRVHEIAGSEYTLVCDMVIFATGQLKQVSFLNQIENLKLDAKGRIAVDETSYQTSNPKYFAGGDAVNGGAEVVNAAAEGKSAAKAIHAQLS